MGRVAMPCHAIRCDSGGSIQGVCGLLSEPYGWLELVGEQNIANKTTTHDSRVVQKVDQAGGGDVELECNLVDFLSRDFGNGIPIFFA